MIRVTYDPGVPMLRALGHAGTAAPGRDLVCAGATVLMLTLARVTEQAGGQAVLKPGLGEIRGTRCQKPAFDTVSEGFRLLGETFPQAVAWEEGGGMERKTET